MKKIRDWIKIAIFSSMLSLNTSLGVRAKNESINFLDNVHRFMFPNKQKKKSHGLWGKRYFK